LLQSRRCGGALLPHSKEKTPDKMTGWGDEPRESPVLSNSHAPGSCGQHVHAATGLHSSSAARLTLKPPHQRSPPIQPHTLNLFFLTNDNKCEIILSKITNSGSPDDGLHKKGAFQYALSSRKYWKILAKPPVFGVKRGMRFPFIRKGLRRKKGRFLCMKRL